LSSDSIEVSVVIPVYRGAATLDALVTEIAPMVAGTATPTGRKFCVGELILVWDNGPDESDRLIRDLAAKHDWVRPVWLSKNFGQHAATLAGIATSGGKWIVTLDEDGQHDPEDIGRLLDTAYRDRAQLVYAEATNKAPHSFFRNLSSAWARWVFTHVLTDGNFPTFSSYRCALGEVARSVAAFTGPGVYLDVALSWVVARCAVCPVQLRAEGRPPRGYSYSRLTGHFGRLVISSGTKPLRVVGLLGIFAAIVGLALAVYVIVGRFNDEVAVAGWTSVTVAVLVIGGAILFTLGVIAEYLGVSVKMAMGTPLYALTSDPAKVFDE
jgi:glycosyltransferase involved in cell wall biosynthesis